jgi:hypothetical protein
MNVEISLFAYHYFTTKALGRWQSLCRAGVKDSRHRIIFGLRYPEFVF